MNLENSMSMETEGVPHTIYKINVLNMVYIGSTDDFRRRISSHISMCNNLDSPHYNIPLYKHIRELESKVEFKFTESCFHIIEEINDCDEEIIKFYERGWIEFYKEEKIEMLNVLKPIQTEEEKKEQNRKDCEKYREKNKEELNRKKREKYAKKKLEKQDEFYEQS